MNAIHTGVTSLLVKIHECEHCAKPPSDFQLLAIQNLNSIHCLVLETGSIWASVIKQFGVTKILASPKGGPL